MEKKILVPTNFSKHSWSALIFAMKLYKKYPCTFYLINAYTSRGGLSEAMSMHKEDDEETNQSVSENGLARIMQGLSFRKENPKHRFEKISFDGNLVDGVEENVKKLGIDIIILGSPGDTAGINTAENNKISKITENIEECPVLVIPEKYETAIDPNLEIVFPTNLRIPFKPRELEPIIELAENTDCSIRILYINTDSKPLNKEQEKNKTELISHLSKVNTSFHTLTKTTATTGVHLFIESRESDFLALYQRKQGFFSRLFNKAAIEDIDFDPKLPVMILKEIK
ncbi:universal stress protein [Christiangramia aquimixticola]|uniref:universal stress protein n=1 Tax=Christiangramia aquimixticola TaxID=1697558 RepID=UPI003AA9A09D